MRLTMPITAGTCRRRAALRLAVLRTPAIISVAGLDDQAISVRALQSWEKACPETETLTTSEPSYVQPSRRKLLSSNLLSTKTVFIDCKGERSFF